MFFVSFCRQKQKSCWNLFHFTSPHYITSQLVVSELHSSWWKVSWIPPFKPFHPNGKVFWKKMQKKTWLIMNDKFVWLEFDKLLSSFYFTCVCVKMIMSFMQNLTKRNFNNKKEALTSLLRFKKIMLKSKNRHENPCEQFYVKGNVVDSLLNLHTCCQTNKLAKHVLYFLLSWRTWRICLQSYF